MYEILHRISDQSITVILIQEWVLIKSLIIFQRPLDSLVLQANKKVWKSIRAMKALKLNN